MLEKDDKIIVDGQQLIVSKVEGNEVFAYMIGGGFEYKVSAAKCQKVKSFPESEFTGFAYFEDGPKYQAICNPMNRWNGWAQPKFTKEIIFQILNADDYKILGEDDTGIKFVDKDAGDEESSQYALKNIDNLYSFDGWCWDFDRV